MTLLRSEDLGHFAVPHERDLRVGERPLLHDLRGAERVAPVDHRHRLAEPGEEHRLFHGRVAAADDRDVVAAEEEPVTGRAPGDAVAAQLLLARHAELLVPRTGGDDHGLGQVGLALGLDHLGVRGQVDRGHVVRQQLGAEPLGLLAHRSISSGPMMASGKPGKFSTSVVCISAPPAVTEPSKTKGFSSARAA